MTDPFLAIEEAMKQAGFDMDNIPQENFDEHVWADGLALWWLHHERLPTALELAEEMFDEWDDPVSTDEAQRILDYLKVSE